MPVNQFLIVQIFFKTYIPIAFYFFELITDYRNRFFKYILIIQENIFRLLGPYTLPSFIYLFESNFNFEQMFKSIE